MKQKLSKKQAVTRFHKPVITIDEILDTFKEGRKDYYDYMFALDSNMSPAKIAEELERNINTIKNWIKGKSTPKIFQTIEVLEFNNLIPLYSDNQRFAAINLLSSFLFWSGCIDGSFTGTYNIGRDIKGDVEDIIKKELGIIAKPSYKNSPKHINQIRLADNGSAYSRLIHCMGVPKSGNGNNGKRDRKTRTKLIVPAYIREISAVLPRLENEEKEKAQLIMDDFIRVLIYSRGNHNGHSYLEIELIANKQRSYAYAFGRQVLNIFKKNYPLSWIDDESLRINPHQRRKNYHPRIVIKRENWECINEHYPHLLDIKKSPLFQS